MQPVLPDRVATALPEPVLALIQNPQALLDPTAAATLGLALVQTFPTTPENGDVVFGALRGGLAGSLHWVFLSSAFVFGSGFLASLFLREVPIPGRGARVTASALSPSPDLARSGRTDSPPALTV